MDTHSKYLPIISSMCLMSLLFFLALSRSIKEENTWFILITILAAVLLAIKFAMRIKSISKQSNSN